MLIPKIIIEEAIEESAKSSEELLNFLIACVLPIEEAATFFNRERNGLWVDGRSRQGKCIRKNYGTNPPSLFSVTSSAAEGGAGLPRRTACILWSSWSVCRKVFCRCAS